MLSRLKHQVFVTALSSNHFTAVLIPELLHYFTMLKELRQSEGLPVFVQPVIIIVKKWN